MLTSFKHIRFTGGALLFIQHSSTMVTLSLDKAFWGFGIDGKVLGREKTLDCVPRRYE